MPKRLIEFARQYWMFILLGLVGLALLFPVAVMLQPRPEIPVVKKDDPEFERVSTILQNKCSDCHTPDKTVYPFYFNFPIAHQIMSSDIKMAHGAMIVTVQQLSGAEPIASVDIAKIGAQVEQGSMPPMRYKALHWKAFLSDQDRETIKAWVAKHQAEVAVKAIPADDPFHLSSAKVALGERLFNEKKLSGDDSVSCASCHSLDKGGADGMVNAIGINGQHGPINSPTVFNAAFNFCQFWDGRAKDLQEQAGGPVNNPKEMGSNWPQAIGKLKAEPQYARAFQSVYGGEITDTNITDAIAAYEKTLLTPHSKFDRFLLGDAGALSDQEKAGYRLFQKNNCATCHAGVNFGGMSFEKMGVWDDYFARRGNPTEADNGRFNVTHRESDLHKFKVPTLRNIEATAPYFHDGSTSDLKQAVKTMAHYQSNKDLSEADADAIVAFLKTLTGEYGGKSVSLKKQSLTQQ